MDGTSSGGINFGGLLALLFITLKLTGHINWSWFWVLSPFWIGFVVFILVILSYIIISKAENGR